MSRNSVESVRRRNAKSPNRQRVEKFLAEWRARGGGTIAIADAAEVAGFYPGLLRDLLTDLECAEAAPPAPAPPSPGGGEPDEERRCVGCRTTWASCFDDVTTCCHLCEHPPATPPPSPGGDGAREAREAVAAWLAVWDSLPGATGPVAADDDDETWLSCSFERAPLTVGHLRALLSGGGGEATTEAPADWTCVPPCPTCHPASPEATA